MINKIATRIEMLSHLHYMPQFGQSSVKCENIGQWSLAEEEDEMLDSWSDGLSDGAYPGLHRILYQKICYPTAAGLLNLKTDVSEEKEQAEKTFSDVGPESGAVKKDKFNSIQLTQRSMQLKSSVKKMLRGKKNVSMEIDRQTLFTGYCD